MVLLTCKQCNKQYSVVPARVETSKYCSYSCFGEWRKENFKGPNNPAWQEGPREKNCAYCEVLFQWNGVTPYSTFKKMKFCSKPCADKGGFRFRGEAHSRFNPNANRKRGGKHHAWANAVISRDNATCMKCGAIGVELHAHHIKDYKNHPELRYELSNGATVCHSCHWAIHTAQNDNGVNSGDILAGDAEDNPEPSPDGNIREGVTTRGRAYRRWEGHCDWCGVFLSKRLSDAKGKKFHFCGYKCSGSHRAK